MKEIHKVKPYTYLIKHKESGRVYYGSRCQNYTKYNRTPAEDLWNYYTTSSENINNIIDKEGKQVFEYEIRRTFDTVEEMADWETRVLIRSRVLEKQDKWFNANVAGKKILTEAGAKRISDAHKGKPKTQEHKNKLRESNVGKNKGRKQTEEHRLKNSLANRGKNNPMYGPCSAQRAANISAAKKGKPAHNKGLPMSEEQKQKIRETKEKNKVLLQCWRCGKAMGKANYIQYGHGPNCKA
jgi:hypothetical protein